MASRVQAEARPPQIDRIVDMGLKILTALVLPLIWWVNGISVRLALLEEANLRLAGEIRVLREEANARDARIVEIHGSVREINTTMTFVREKVQEIAHAVHATR